MNDKAERQQGRKTRAMLKISRREARRLAIASQGLRRRVPFGRGRYAALAALERLGYVQLDTIAVVERAHHQAFWARVPDYRPLVLEQLLADRMLFEYWSHAAAYLPISDYRYTLRRKRRYDESDGHWHRRDRKLEREVLARIRAEGPLMARDFSSKRTGSGPWWDWRPTKIALESLFLVGHLMILGRKNFAKVYDLTERVLPHGVDQSMPSADDQTEHLITRVLQAHGLAAAKEIYYLRRGTRQGVLAALKRLSEEGRIVPTCVAGCDEQYYVLPRALETVRGKRFSSQTMHILSPFDNILIQRERLQTLFDYEYQIECYTPKHKRRWGYFCHSLLCGTVFVGRFDAKAERSEQRLRIRSLHFEPTWQSDMLPTLAAALRHFAAFNCCNEVLVDTAVPARVRNSLQRLLGR